MKKLWLIVLCLFLTGCGTEPLTVTVFAAASLTETVTELAERYEAENSAIDVVLQFDSSGTLRRQIDEGAECDLFLSAGKKQTEGMKTTELLKNQVVLVGEAGSFSDLQTRLRQENVLLAMGNENVPVGQYGASILLYHGFVPAELAAKGLVTLGSSAKEVVTQVREGTADCGIVYRTDAAAAGLAVRDVATEAMCGQVIYPAALLDGSAKGFLRFLQTETAREVFREAGFEPLQGSAD